MNFDLGSLSDNELDELFKNIKVERAARDNPLRYKAGVTNLVTKDDGTFTKYINALNKHMEKYEIPTGKICKYYENYRDLQKSCLKICDITLGNYKAAQTQFNDIRRTCNGQKIELDDPTEYAEMYQELFAVIDKHLFKEDK